MPRSLLLLALFGVSGCVSSGAPDPACGAATRPLTTKGDVRWQITVEGEVQDDVADHELVLTGPAAGCTVTEVQVLKGHQEGRRLHCNFDGQWAETIAGCTNLITHPADVQLTLDERIAISYEGNKAFLQVDNPQKKRVNLRLECFTVEATVSAEPGG